MSNTDRDSMLERWADGMEKLEQYYEGIYGPPATPPSLPPITTRDAMLEAIADGMERVKRNINKKSPTYHNTDSAYAKTVPSGDVHYASLEQIGGKTLVFNQLFPQRTISPTAYDGYTVSADGTGAYTITVTAETASSNGGTNHTNLSIPLYNHVVALTTDSPLIKVKMKNVNKEGNIVFKYDKESGYNNVAFIFTDLPQGTYTVHPMITDLTLAFGSGNEPATVDEFRQIFPADFYTYNPGSLLSAGVTSVVSKDSTNTEIATHPIPAEVQALDEYGLSTGAAYNYIDFEAKKFVQNVGSVDLSALTFGYGPTVGWSATLPNVKNPADDDTAFNGLSATLKATDRNTQATAFSGGTDAGMVSVAGGKVYVGTGSISIVPSGTLIYELDEPVETDISAYLTDDGLISVEAGGTLTFPNSNGDDYRIDVPSEETFIVGAT